MDAVMSRAPGARTNDVAADGQVVSSWHPDAGVKFAEKFAGDGGQQARRTRENTKQPLKPLRRECRMFRRTCSSNPCAFYCTWGYGCGERPAFPAPSAFQEGQST